MKYLYLFLVISVLTSKIFAVDFYISPKGSDQNSGSIEKPFKTISGAKEHVRIFLQNHDVNDDINVWLREGTYYLEKSVEFDNRDSGNETAKVIYQSFSGEDVFLSGGKSVPVNLVESVYDTRILDRLLSDQAKKHLKQIDLKTIKITDFGEHKQFGFGLPVVCTPLEFYINNEKMDLAQYPNDGFVKIGQVIDHGSVPRRDDYENIRGGTFEYSDFRHEKWQDINNVWLKGTFNRGYADDYIQIKSIDTLKKQITLASPHMYGLASGKDFQQYKAINIFEEIDTPGEWYLDRDKSILYFWPPDNVTLESICVSMLKDPMVVFENSSFIEFRNVVFQNTRGMGIYIEEGSNILIRGCVLRNIGTVAVMMGQGAKQTFPHITHDQYTGEPVSREIGSLRPHLYDNSVWDRKAGHHHGVQSCEIYNTGIGGIILSGGSKKTLTPGYCFVDNCKIYDFQTRVGTQGNAIAIDGCGNRISHCEIFNSEQQAILVYGNDHVFEYNNIHHIALNTNDASAWYTGRNPSDRGHIIRYNFFHHIGRPDRELIMGIYFDDSACGVDVIGNIFYKVASYGTIYSNAGSDLKIRNNIFIEGYGPALQLKSRWWDRLLTARENNLGENSIFYKRLVKEIDLKSPPYSTHYPELMNWMDITDDGENLYGMFPERNEFSDNIIVNYPETCRLTGIYSKFQFGNNCVIKGDPGFSDYGNMDFNLEDYSVVYRKLANFKPVPFNEMGLYKDDFRNVVERLIIK